MTHITQVTKENQIVNDDDKGLLKFYYTLSDCLIILQHLNYEMVFKVQTDVLHKTIRQLSNKVLYNGEHCLNLRNTRTPPLIDMEP